jgi:tetratricopeptide (TPR) repeat protein
MRRARSTLTFASALLVPLALAAAWGPLASADTPAGAPPAATPSPAGAPPATTRSPAPNANDAGTFAAVLRAYHSALAARHLGVQELRREEIAARVAEAEQWTAAGRVDEAIARLVPVVEDPEFDNFADSEEGRAAVFRLGDALATAGVSDPARGYLRRILDANGTKSAWDAGRAVAPPAIWARRAVRRLVDIALETEQYDLVLADLKSVPDTAPEEVRGEVAYVEGRAKEASGDPDGALAAYGRVTQRCRFWASATYLSALIHVERGRYQQGENLLCKVADPKRIASTTPVFADERFFAVRDLARLGLGRIAHEQGRNDDARYYYYLVPQDSDRLAEALYEAATTRYEKKDYDGARDLLDELGALRIHHRYEDEAWVLDAWVDLARCRFADADKKLVTFLAQYEPVRDGARRIGQSDASTGRLLAAVHAGTDAAGAEIGGVTPEVVRAIAALVRLDPAYDRVVRRRGVLEREASGLSLAMASVNDMQRALATNGGVRPAVELGEDDARKADDARQAILGVERQIADLEAAHAAPDAIAPLRHDLADLRGRLEAGGPNGGASAPSGVAAGADLPDLLGADAAQVGALQARIAAMRKILGDQETALARDALHRLDLRLSRLLRRARLGRIESVLGRKRALEVEVEAIRLGYLPQDAVDSLDAARYLEDNEEYWPFEGDDWPDEYVGGEVK